MKALELTVNDVVCGIATSGRTPYVIGGVRHARSVGAFTVGVVCTTDSELAKEVELCISPVVGSEVLTGSTRLKAGTATKLVLNTLTTAAMVRGGKSFGNLMVDLKASNAKLVARANRIVRACTGLTEADAAELLTRCDGEVKTAIVARLANLDATTARARLSGHGGRIKPALAGVGRATGAVRELKRRPDLVLGIDGGGTTTICLLAETATGKVLGAGRRRAVEHSGGGRGGGTSGTRRRHRAGVSERRTPTGEGRFHLPRLGRGGPTGRIRRDSRVGGTRQRGRAGERVERRHIATGGGTPDGWGLAVIAGTGSIAFVKTPDGTLGRCGGWGYLLGDEGSAYMLTVAALRAACRSFDGIAPPTMLVEAFVKRMNLSEPPDLIPAVYRGPWDRTAIAGMALVVLGLAEGGDEVAADIVRQQARELALTAAGAVSANGLPKTGLPVALAGGVLTNSELYRRHFLDGLRDAGIEPAGVILVTEPATGAVVLARQTPPHP